jgi:hypothetical protein
MDAMDAKEGASELMSLLSDMFQVVNMFATSQQPISTP